MSYPQPTGVEACAPTPGLPAERFTRVFVTVDATAVIFLAFAFGFGNGWTTALRLGVSPWIAPLAQPAVDLAVVGLMIALRYLAIHGWTDEQLAKPRWWLRFFGLLTMAMNCALPIGEKQYNRAAWDAIGPILLIAWSELAPWLLRAIHSVRVEVTARAPEVTPPSSGAEAVEVEEAPAEAAPEVPASVTWTGDVATLARQVCLDRERRGLGYMGTISEVFDALQPIWQENGQPPLTRRYVGMRCSETWDDLHEHGLVSAPRPSVQAA